MIGLFLDDERNPEDVSWINYPENIEWIVVRTKIDFDLTINQLFSERLDFIVSFDHDIQDFLEGTELTGYDCVKSLVDHCVYTDTKFPEAFFHTQNPIGRNNMEGYYKAGLNFFYGKRT